MKRFLSTTEAFRRESVLLAVCLAACSLPLAFTAPAVALPALASALGGSPLALTWVTNAYLLTFGSVLLAAGGLADNYGRKLVFLLGTSAFAILSGALAFAPDIFVFDLLRAAEGIAAAASLAAGMAALAQDFVGAGRSRAFSFVGASFGIGLSVAPIASAMLLARYGWRGIFAVVVGASVLATMVGWFAMRETRDPDAVAYDWTGTAAFTTTLTCLTFGVLEAPEWGWGDPRVLAFLVAAALLAFGFVAVERRAERPMLELDLFRYPRFVGVQLLAAAPAYGFVVLLIILPVRLVGVDGMSADDAARTIAALSMPLLVLPLASGLLTRWFSPAALCAVGLCVTAAGLFWLSQVPIGSGVVSTALPLVVIGTGMSLPWGLMDGLAVSVVPSHRAGMAAGIFSTVRVAGEGIALAAVSVLLSRIASLCVDPDAVSTPAARDIAARHLVTGDLAEASRLLTMSPATIVERYGSAFSTMLLVLGAITLLTAAGVYSFLRTGSGELSPDP